MFDNPGANDNIQDVLCILPMLRISLQTFPMLKITIPNPCHENWAHMQPNEQGRHCNSCSKTVVDFTEMNDEEVKNFLISKQYERICGRFSNKQLRQISIELPQNIFQVSLPFWKQFLVASLLVFSSTLFSCDANTQGAPLKQTALSTGLIAIHDSAVKNLNLPDTVPASKHRVGKPKVCRPLRDAVDQGIKGDIVIKPQQRILVGEPAYIPVKDTLPKKAQGIIMGKMIAVPGKPNDK